MTYYKLCFIALNLSLLLPRYLVRYQIIRLLEKIIQIALPDWTSLLCPNTTDDPENT